MNLETLLSLLLLVEPPASSESTAEPSAAPFVEDMPDPYAPEWEPPEGPRRPPPTPPPPPSVALQAELPPNAAAGPGSSAPSVQGQRLQLAGVVFGVGGVIGLAVGVYLYDDLSKKKNELSAAQAFVDAGGGSPGRVEELQSQIEKEQLGMTVSLVAGGSSLGLGAILFGVGTAVKKRPASSAITWLAPGPGLVGLSLKGRF